MVSIQNGEGFALVEAYEKHGSRRGITANPIAEGGNLGQKRPHRGVVATIGPNAFAHLGDGEVATRKFSPQGAWKNPDLGQVCWPHFYLKPFRSLRQLSPQGKMSNKQKSPTVCIFFGIVQV